MRRLLVVLHRWSGLLIAGFLFVTGITGAIISWDHELDEWLNPQLTAARARGPLRDALQLAAELEARHPQVRVAYAPLAAEAGHALSFWVEPRIDPQTGRRYVPGFNQVFIDPVSGAELGKREWGAVWPVTRENFVSFLYKLHFSLHLPAWGGIDRWGIWLLGIVALIWTIDCFTGLILTLPSRRRSRMPAPDDGEAEAVPRGWWQRWTVAWKIRWRGGSYKLNYDLHRAGSLWAWGLLFILAFTAFSLNLYREIFFPAMSLVSNVTPTPFDTRQPVPYDQPTVPKLDFRQAVELAAREARQRGWDLPAGSVFHSGEFGIYRVAFFRPEDGHGAGGVGHREIYLDSRDGMVLGERQPWQGTAADLFVQAQFPLHSGRILGLPGRILISAMGLVVAMLSVTGVYIWWRKKRPRNLPQPASMADISLSQPKPV